MKLVDIAGGHETTFMFPAGSIFQGIKVNGNDVTPKAISGCSVTLEEAPAYGSTVEITLDPNRAMTYCPTCGQSKTQ